jgi:hypothetical protein
MHIRLTTSSWGYDMVFEMDTGESGEDSQQESSLPKRFLKVVNILALIARSRISPFIPGPMGLDGVTYSLTMSEGTSISSFEWWTEAEKGWRALDGIARELIKLAERKAGKPFPLFSSE